MHSMFAVRKELPVAHRNRERTLYCDAPSSLGAAEGLCMLVRHFLRRSNQSEIAFTTEVTLRECLNNAIHHGNQHDPKRRIRLWVAAREHGVSLRVADSGKGFNWQKYSEKHAPENTALNGRGLAIIGFYATRVVFNRKGNVITVDIAGKPSRGEKP